MTNWTDRLNSIWRALPFAGPEKPLVTVIEMTGVIGEIGAGRKGLTLKKLEKPIADAFKPKGVKAVVLAINSPGGSPVQSRLIFSAVRREAKEKDVPVLAFIEDAGASGGYILALAGDEIYADESSIVGSIGVISGGFGFHEAIGRLGVERRVYTAGENKSQLDPFQPEDPEDVARLKDMLNELHQQFIALVKERRGDKLSEDETLFSGRFWSGAMAVEKGLVDGTAQFGDFLRDRFGKDVKIKRISQEKGSLLKLLFSGGAQSPSEGLALVDAEELAAAGERRALWARIGL
jgi:serine protease SohB